MKFCRKCGQTKPLTEFTKHNGAKSGPDKIRSTCKACCHAYDVANRERIRERKREYLKRPGKKEHAAHLRKLRHEANPHRRTDKWRQRIYSLSVKDFRVMLGKQEGCCAICASVLKNTRTGTHVDHDHKTGEVRGLLCPPCNRGLGAFRDSTQRLESASAYLKLRML